MNPLRYAVKLNAEDDGYVVTCRDLLEAITQGDSRQEALQAAAGALQAAIEGRLLDRDDLPLPSPARRGEALVDVPAHTAIKAHLYTAMRVSQTTNTQLAQWLGVDEKQVRRMLDPHHASRLDALERALDALGKRLVVEVRDKAAA